MLRSILAAVVGYIAMVVVVLAGIALAWAVLGGSGAFAGEGPKPSTAWIAMNLVGGFLAAFVGSLVALKIGRSARAVKILIGLLLVLGVVSAVTANSVYEKREPVGKPVAEMSFREAGQHAKQPAWYNWVIPLVGVAGACLGGRSRKSSGT